MSLIKKPAMTEKKVAANRRNQSLCNGPLVDERRGRIRAALRRFGFDAQAEETAMRALGEEPAHFQELLEGLWEEYNPVAASQEGVVVRLARAMWLMNRADRMQEGYAVRQAQDVSSGRQDRVHAQMMRLKMTEDRLRRLAQAVAQEHYVTSREDLEAMKNVHQEGVVKEMSEIAVALFYELQAPGTGEDGEDPEEKTRRVMNKIRGIFGLSPLPLPEAAEAEDGSQPEEGPQDVVPPEEEKDERYPNITPAEWQARERPRQLLENILGRQVEACASQRKAIRKESVSGPSPYERAAEIAPTHPNARVMRRMQDSNFREVRRLTNLLLKIKRYERQTEGLAKG